MPQSSLAQLQPDSTLSTESSQVKTISPQQQVIEGGATEGSNLFHSFSEFNVNENQTVNFASPEGIANIFSRVTGSNVSQILGDLGVLGNANLWLLNPNGIIFGEDASLNINGSFIATTAHSVNFQNGSQFTANAAGQPLLTVSQPTALEFGSQPGRIVNRARSPRKAFTTGQFNILGSPAGLLVQPQQTLALIGGEILLEGGNITASGGKIELGAVGANSVVGMELSETEIAFDYDRVASFANVRLSEREGEVLFLPFDESGSPILDENGQPVVDFLPATLSSLVDASSTFTPSGEPAVGKIEVVGNNVELLNGSQLQTFSLVDLPAGDVRLQAASQITLRGFNLQGEVTETPSTIFSASTGTEDSGDISLSARKVILQDKATINSSTVEGFDFETGESTIPEGDAGRISVEATEAITLDSNAEISSSSNSLGEGTGGIVNLTTQSLSLDGESRIIAETVATNGGNINIKADTIELRNQSAISASVGGFGNGGNIGLDTQFLITSPQDNSDITANAERGMGGRIAIAATGIYGIQFRDATTDLSDLTVSSDFGTAGEIELNNPEIQLENIESTQELQFTSDATAFVPNSCYAYLGNKYIITGKGGIPLISRSTLSAEFSGEDWRIIPPGSADNSTNSSSNIENLDTPQTPTSVRGWYANERGKIVLTSEPLTYLPQPVANNGC